MQLLNLVGNLGSDAQLIPNNGKPFVSFNVANTERWKDAEGNQRESTNWVSCALNGTNENLLPYLKVGAKVCCVGRITTRVYSSEKERRMVAGINMSVTHIELIGGNTDDVPRKLFTTDGVQVDVFKAYYAAPDVVKQLCPKKGDVASLQSMRGDRFSITHQGWITRIISNPQATQNEETNPDGTKVEVY